MFVHSLRKKLGAQLHQLFDNEDEELQGVIDDCSSSGLTRIELRFERRNFGPVEYYQQQLELAFDTFVNSGAIEVRSLATELNAVLTNVKDCLLFIEESSSEYYIAWYKNNAYQSQIYGVNYRDCSFFFPEDKNKETQKVKSKYPIHTIDICRYVRPKEMDNHTIFS